jgi:hypothetical protein
MFSADHLHDLAVGLKDQDLRTVAQCMPSCIRAPSRITIPSTYGMPQAISTFQSWPCTQVHAAQSPVRSHASATQEPDDVFSRPTTPLSTQTITPNLDLFLVPDGGHR